MLNKHNIKLHFSSLKYLKRKFNKIVKLLIVTYIVYSLHLKMVNYELVNNK